MFVLKRWLIIVLVAVLAVSCSNNESEPEPDSGADSADVLADANFEISVDKPCEIEAGKSIPLSVDSTAGQALPTGATVMWQATGGRFSTDEGTLTSYTAEDVTEDTTVRIQATLSADSGSVPLSVECLVTAAEADSEEVEVTEPTSEPVVEIDEEPEDNDEMEEPIVPEETTVPPTEEVVVELPPEVTVEELIDGGKVIVAVHEAFEPFSFQDDAGTYMGFEIDIATEFARRWFGDENAIEYRYVGGDEKFAILERGEAHLTIAAVTRTPERCLRVNCTINYFEDGARILVHPDSGIMGICDLDGKDVSGRANTTALLNIEEQMPRWCAYDVPPLAVSYPDREGGIDAVKTGIVDAYTTDGTALVNFARDNPPLIVVGDPFTSEPYSALAALQNVGIRDLMDATLQQMKLDGTYDTLFIRWFGCDGAPFPVITDKVYPDNLLELATPDELIPAETCAPPPQEYVVMRNDTLGGISDRFLGSFALYPCIHEANREVIGEDPSRMSAGITLQIPDISQCDSG